MSKYDIYNPDPNEGIMCGDCGWIFKRKELTWIQGHGGGKSLCDKCRALRDSSNKQGHERYVYPETEEVKVAEN